MKRRPQLYLCTVSALAHEETEMEKVFLCHRMAEEVVAGHLPLSNEFAEELCALYAQVNY